MPAAPRASASRKRPACRTLPPGRTATRGRRSSPGRPRPSGRTPAPGRVRARHRRAGRRVVPARHRALDDEPVDPPGGLPRHRGRENVGGDDGEEGGAPQLSRRAGQDAGGRQVGAEVVQRARTLDGERHRDVLATAQPIEDGGDLARDPRPHDHEVDAGQHRAVEARQHRDLDLGQQVDADRPVVPLLGEEHLDERRGDGLLDELGRIVEAVLLGKPRALAGAARPREVRGDDAVRDPLVGERREGAAHVSALVAVRRRPAMIASIPVPDTTPSWPPCDTALASTQLETPAPMPPWMINGLCTVHLRPTRRGPAGRTITGPDRPDGALGATASVRRTCVRTAPPPTGRQSGGRPRSCQAHRSHHHRPWHVRGLGASGPSQRRSRRPQRPAGEREGMWP